MLFLLYDSNFVTFETPPGRKDFSDINITVKDFKKVTVSIDKIKMESRLKTNPGLQFIEK